MDARMESDEWMEELLGTKTFSELSELERNFVLNEVGSEEHYNMLRKISKALVANKADLSPDPLVLKNLKRKMVPPRPLLVSIINYKIPAYSFLLLIGFFATVFLILRKSQNGPNVQFVTKTDTLFVTVPADTIFVERVEYKYKDSYSSKPKSPGFDIVRNIEKADKLPSEGVSMKEKEELENLLISGS